MGKNFENLKKKLLRKNENGRKLWKSTKKNFFKNENAQKLQKSTKIKMKKKR